MYTPDYTLLDIEINHQKARDMLHKKFPEAVLHRARPYHVGGNWKGPSHGSRPYKTGHRHRKEVITIRGYEKEERYEE